MTEQPHELQTINPSTPAVSSGEKAATAVATSSRASIEVAAQMAMMRPRNIDRVRQSLLRDCQRPSFVFEKDEQGNNRPGGAIYVLPFGKKETTGFSIRFAEAAFQAYGNVYATRATLFDDENMRITRVAVTDLETNAWMSDDATTSKLLERRFLKKGQAAVSEHVNADGVTNYVIKATDREALGKINADKSKAFRNAMIALLPGWLKEDCATAIRKTQANTIAEDPDAAKNKVIDAFQDLGVSVDDLAEFLGKPPSKCTKADTAELGLMWSAIGKGDATWDQYMENRQPKHAAEEVADGYAEPEAKEEEKKPVDYDSVPFDDPDAPVKEGNQ